MEKGFLDRRILEGGRCNLALPVMEANVSKSIFKELVLVFPEKVCRLSNNYVYHKAFFRRLGIRADTKCPRLCPPWKSIEKTTIFQNSPRIPVVMRVPVFEAGRPFSPIITKREHRLDQNWRSTMARKRDFPRL